MAAFRVRTPDAHHAVEIVAAARKPFADVPDALEALHSPPKLAIRGAFRPSWFPHRVMGVDADDELIDPQEVAERGSFGSPQSFDRMVLENRKLAGVQQAHKDDRITFESVTPWPGEFICSAKGDTSKAIRRSVPGYSSVPSSALRDQSALGKLSIQRIRDDAWPRLRYLERHLLEKMRMPAVRGECVSFGRRSPRSAAAWARCRPTWRRSSRRLGARRDRRRLGLHPRYVCGHWRLLHLGGGANRRGDTQAADYRHLAAALRHSARLLRRRHDLPRSGQTPDHDARRRHPVDGHVSLSQGEGSPWQDPKPAPLLRRAGRPAGHATHPQSLERSASTDTRTGRVRACAA